MKPPATANEPTDPSPAVGKMTDDAATGLPGLRTWRAVYLFVLGCFIVWVGLLALLTRMFS
jgi:hypothetical protein